MDNTKKSVFEYDCAVELRTFVGDALHRNLSQMYVSMAQNRALGPEDYMAAYARALQLIRDWGDDVQIQELASVFGLRNTTPEGKYIHNPQDLRLEQSQYFRSMRANLHNLSKRYIMSKYNCRNRKIQIKVPTLRSFIGKLYRTVASMEPIQQPQKTKIFEVENRALFNSLIQECILRVLSETVFIENQDDEVDKSTVMSIGNQSATMSRRAMDLMQKSKAASAASSKASKAAASVASSKASKTAASVAPSKASKTAASVAASSKAPTQSQQTEAKEEEVEDASNELPDFSVVGSIHPNASLSQMFPDAAAIRKQASKINPRITQKVQNARELDERTRLDREAAGLVEKKEEQPEPPQQTEKDEEEFIDFQHEPDVEYDASNSTFSSAGARVQQSVPSSVDHSRVGSAVHVRDPRNEELLQFSGKNDEEDDAAIAAIMATTVSSNGAHLFEHEGTKKEENMSI